MVFQSQGGQLQCTASFCGPPAPPFTGSALRPLPPRQGTRFGFMHQDSPQGCLSWLELFCTSTCREEKRQTKDGALWGASQRGRAEQGQAEKVRPRGRPPKLPCTVPGAPSLRFDALWPSVVGTCPGSLGLLCFLSQGAPSAWGLRPSGQPQHQLSCESCDGPTLRFWV